jgi:hypothetical protein
MFVLHGLSVGLLKNKGSVKEDNRVAQERNFHFGNFSIQKFSNDFV